MNRRTFVQSAVLAGVGGALGGTIRPTKADVEALPEPSPSRLPRWRGFNLLSKFNSTRGGPFPEANFEAIHDLGFNFARLPMDYRTWTNPNDLYDLREPVLKEIDQAVEFGHKYGVHVQINFHRAPGYTVANPPESPSLWEDAGILKVCQAHWAHFAKRYQGRPNREVSFNLLNEPNNKVTPEQHRRVVEALCEAIRAVDPDRLIVCDGRSWARTAPEELLGLNVAAALHGYDPMPVSHYRASWVGGSDRWPVPTWPLKEGERMVDKAALARPFGPWETLQKQGMGVMVGEFGAYNRTPHGVVLAWLEDQLDLFRQRDWGWALWNLDGSFGIIDSGRDDVDYEAYRGRKLDRKMVTLLQRY
jgi:endoglucanase